jgi:acyl carrier protein
VSEEEKVINIISDQLDFPREKLNRSSRFIEDIGADSLDIVELVMELEEEFDTQIPDDQAEKIKTVGDAIDYIAARKKEKESGEVSTKGPSDVKEKH